MSHLPRWCLQLTLQRRTTHLGAWRHCCVLQCQLGCPWPAEHVRQTDDKQTHGLSDDTSICSAPQHARESGAYVARELLGKQQPDYDYMPYFYSRIYDLGWVVRPPTRSH